MRGVSADIMCKGEERERASPDSWRYFSLISEREKESSRNSDRNLGKPELDQKEIRIHLIWSSQKRGTAFTFHPSI